MRQLRRDEGLRRQCDPIFKDKFSRNLVLALFSSCLAQKQPDWPRQTVQTGFVFSDELTPAADAAPVLSDFLASGEPPLVFTQGSTAVHNPGEFYRVSAAAARRLNKRAVLIGVEAVPNGYRLTFWRFPMHRMRPSFRAPPAAVRLSYNGLPFDAIEDLLPFSRAYREAVRSVFAPPIHVAGGPLTPLHEGHAGILSCSGLLNGVFGQGGAPSCGLLANQQEDRSHRTDRRPRYHDTA